MVFVCLYIFFIVKSLIVRSVKVDCFSLVVCSSIYRMSSFSVLSNLLHSLTVLRFPLLGFSKLVVLMPISGSSVGNFISL